MNWQRYVTDCLPSVLCLANKISQALDDEAEALVKKLWRMVIFFTESEKRGLSA
jgi:hypothetical protein